MGDDDPRGLAILPQGHDWKDLCWVPLIIATHKILKLLTSEKKIFFTFSYCKSTGDDDPWGVANQDSRSMIGRIYVGYQVNPGSSFEQTMMGWSSRC